MNNNNEVNYIMFMTHGSLQNEILKPTLVVSDHVRFSKTIRPSVATELRTTSTQIIAYKNRNIFVFVSTNALALSHHRTRVYVTVPTRRTTPPPKLNSWHAHVYVHTKIL